MRMSELSARSGRSIPTIKYYLREGLVPPGDRTAANQARYGEAHVRRLRLITTLIEVGGLPLAQVRAVVDAIDDEGLGILEVLGRVHHGLGVPGGATAPAPELSQAEEEIDDFLGAMGWRVSNHAPARRELAGALLSLRRSGWDAGPEIFGRYAGVAFELAAWELARTPMTGSRTDAVEAVVVGTIVFETALVALRRLAQEHHAAAQGAEVSLRIDDEGPERVGHGGPEKGRMA